ncbi:MAG: alpha-E domain-containing protein [Rhizobiales bacterium TMED94]|nr:hypothetical protein [Rhodobiaceae bacterium]RPF86731.1 MAG: alpha-E domain-containing protein [Rhizobiales bacterium TMED94]|tara:strand:+ start:307 stop:1242 length:936 start_codon:yes stop_codon:yes gene_type:complete
MLGRYADNLYWMARYLERAENTARKIQAGLHYSITSKENNNDLLKFLIEDQDQKIFKNKFNDFSLHNVLNYLINDEDNENNIKNLLHKARVNGKIVRTGLTREVSNSLNQSWSSTQKLLDSPIKINNLPEIIDKVLNTGTVFRGSVYGTMLRNDTFNFIRIGTFIERSNNTASILNTKYYRILLRKTVLVSKIDYNRWEILLRSLSAWRSFNWLSGEYLDPAAITNFLIFDERMPRSLSFCNKEILSNLSYLQKTYKKKYQSFNIAKKTQNSLTSGIIRTVHNKKLYNFIKEYTENNENLHFMITRDFNLV